MCNPLIMLVLAIVIFVLYNTIWQSFKEAWKEVQEEKKIRAAKNKL